MTFKDWVIARNLGKDSPKGDFAEDVRSDPDTPREDDRDAWLEHLQRHHACPEALDVFEKLFAEYTVWRKKKQMFLKESEIEAWLKSRIEKLGGMFLKFTSPGNDGVPDRIVIMPTGICVFLELKMRRGKLSEIQKYQIRKLLDCCQQVAVVYGPDAAEDFLKDLQRHVVSSVAYYGKGESDFLECVI